MECYVFGMLDRAKFQYPCSALTMQKVSWQLAFMQACTFSVCTSSYFMYRKLSARKQWYQSYNLPLTVHWLDGVIFFSICFLQCGRFIFTLQNQIIYSHVLKMVPFGIGMHQLTLQTDLPFFLVSNLLFILSFYLVCVCMCVYIKFKAPPIAHSEANAYVGCARICKLCSYHT